MVSKFAGFQGGVERHLADLSVGLVRAGHEVDLFSSELLPKRARAFDVNAGSAADRAKALVQMYWNRAARQALETKVGDFEPDVVHMHSIYHQLSPSVLGVFAGPTVMTLHDYKLAAPCYTLYREGQVCRDCVGRAVPVPAVIHRCIQGSVAASAACSVEAVLYRRRYRSAADRFIVPSQFSRDAMVRAGLPREKIRVIPWASTSATHSARRFVERERVSLLFMGRLHPTKGIRELLDAWAELGSPAGGRLRIAGDGELAGLVVERTRVDPTIEYLGHVEPNRASELVAGADLMVVPSLFPETMGLSALEALVSGTPILTSGRGALSGLAGPGVLEFSEMEARVMARTLRLLISEPERLGSMREQLQRRDLSRYRPERMIREIADVYEELVSV
ncbi:glycosyltransferase family 4 protein [Nocardioides sp. LMS-CY]|uniref:glycosyltransferase family 4 protein n=1 Tax=Nocardioides sp. (strain LMS-CY) TaxID=2840457 RepID=UPI001C004FE7|nr:glycosyltransferase family 4 protein [Nocardioides sp. LMS-CY]QWF21707.1 glycosyltransferase family 4 protein [Nocardioides sp. LMS-CY]